MEIFQKGGYTAVFPVIKGEKSIHCNEIVNTQAQLVVLEFMRYSAYLHAIKLLPIIRVH